MQSAAMAASFTACGSTAAESAADSTASGEAAAEAAADAEVVPAPKGLRVLKARRVRLPADLLPAGAGLKRLHHVRHAGGGRGQLPGPLAQDLAQWLQTQAL